MKARTLILAVALSTISLTAVPASAAPIASAGARSIAAAADQASPFVEVRHRRWHRRHSRWHGHRHRDYGGAVAAGAIFGLAAGAIAANAAAGNDAVAYCMQRFRSYDPASGTYLGYDGLRHPCP
jgi:hypothetical protein